MVLKEDDELELVAEAENGEQLLSLLDQRLQDVILLDLQMPGMDGIRATEQIRISYPDVKILVLTMNDDEQLVMHLMELGANGYLVKNADADEIRMAMHACYENGYYFSDMVSTLMLNKLVRKKELRPKFRDTAPLNERETDVLKLICEGHTAAEIGKLIFLSPRTIEGIKSDLLEHTIKLK